MKKVMAVLMVVLLALFLVGCSGPCSVLGCKNQAASGENFCPSHKAAGWKVR